MGKVLKFVRKCDLTLIILPPTTLVSSLDNTDPKRINSIPVSAMLLMCTLDRM